MLFQVFYFVFRRHHSVCWSEDFKGIYLIGGFGRNRLILDKVDYVCVHTGSVIELPPMPTQMYSPASCFFRGRLFVLKSHVYVYHPNTTKWSKMEHVILPKHIEFNRAIVHGSYIYLTGNHAYELYRFNPDEKKSSLDRNIDEDEQELELLGKFSNEAQNVCVVGNTIYNFSTDQFEYNSTIETFDLNTKKFQVVWGKDTEEFDFSPYYSSGCFPLVIY